MTPTFNNNESVSTLVVCKHYRATLLVKSARFQKLFSEKNLAEKKSKKKTKENNAIRV